MSQKKPCALVALVIAVALLLASCVATRKSNYPSLAELRAKPERQASAYAPDLAAALAKKLVDRIAPIPEAALDNYRKLDGIPTYAAYSPSSAERELLDRYCELLPPPFKRAIEEKLLGVYFIENFAGGGMTDFVFAPSGDAGGDSLYFILILNPRILKMSLGDWIAYRDASPYEAGGSELEMRSSCTGAKDYRGLLQTLTHEAAHVYDYVHHVTPFVEPALGRFPDRTIVAAEDCGFTRGAWEDYAKSLATYAIPRRAETASYGLGPKQPLSVALDQYRALAKTPFASFYGSGSWAEDFAEAATWTYLRDKLGIGYEVTILRGGARSCAFLPTQAAGARRGAGLSARAWATQPPKRLFK